MRKYRHVVACMIEESLGYFTPLGALRQIQAFREGYAPSCEWYSWMDREPYPENMTQQQAVAEHKQHMRNIHVDVVRSSYKHRHMNNNHADGLAVVDANLKGHVSLLASWF